MGVIVLVWVDTGESSPVGTVVDSEVGLAEPVVKSSGGVAGIAKPASPVQLANSNTANVSAANVHRDLSEVFWECLHLTPAV